MARKPASALVCAAIEEDRTMLHTSSAFGSRSLIALGLWLAAATAAPAQTMAPAPEAATGRTAKTLGTAQRYMAAAANPLAAAAGREMLRAGGSATDAAIAIQLVLNLVEPQSSGIGGGAFFVYWDEAGRQMTTLDGRETAPKAARPERFLGADGKPMKFVDAVVGGRSVGVPGTVRLLEEAHKRWGKLPWAEVFAPAIRLAEEGFAISPRLNGLLAQETNLGKDARAATYFYEADGKPKPVGAILKNPAFATTLRAIAGRGADAFYEGAIAEDIVATVTGHATNPGDITLDDLAAYKVEERAPVCGRYRAYTLCGMGPPSSGAVAVQQILGMLETKDIARAGAGAEAAHWFAEAGKLAFADRALYLGDPAFVHVPISGLIDEEYIRERAKLISPDKAMAKASAGTPPNKRAFLFAPSDGVENGTSHISVIDAAGNAVSMTTTIEDGFGSRLMTKGGFLLNNELTDFSFAPTEDGKPSPTGSSPASARAPRWRRPSSSMPLAGFMPSPARPAAARSSAMSPRRWSPCSTGRWTRSAPSISPI
jgi:gamma-glutamyltranspeptidase/glutathione hydrolase